MRIFVLISTSVALTTSCKPTSEAVFNDALLKRFDKLESEVNAIKTDLEVNRVLQDLKDQNVVWFDPQENQSYTPVRAPAGPVLVVLEKIEPYLDGFKIYLRLGNPSNAAYSGLSAKVSWGRLLDKTKDFSHNQLSHKEILLNDVLPPSSWTTIQFNVAPAAAEQVRRIGFAPTFNKIVLRGSTQ